MLINKKNINNPIIIKWFNSLIQLIRFSHFNENGIQGSFVYKYILACYYFAYDWKDFNSFKKIVEYFGSIYINNLNIIINNEHKYEYKMNILSIYDNLKLMNGSLSINQTDSYDNINAILLINHKSTNINFRINFISVDSLKKKSLFIIDTVIFASMGLIINNYEEINIVKFALNFVPQLKIQNLDYESNKNILSSLIIHDVVIQYIINLTIENKTVWIGNKFLVIDIHKHMNNIIKNGFKIIENTESDLYIQEYKTDQECSICMELLDDVVCKLSCNHLFHFNCIKTWINIKNDKIIEYDKINITCPYCRHPIG
jgi:hypothetical protein